MTDTHPDISTLAMPVLLRWGRHTYGEAMRRALAAADCEDMPPNGMFVIGSLARGAGDAPLAALSRQLGVSKQAAGQLVDTLVLRDYLKREADTEDRRKVSVKLTERGWHAASVQRGALEAVDAALTTRAGDAAVGAARQVLAALVEIGGVEGRPAEPRCRSVVPIMPMRDIACTEAFYQGLGFRTERYNPEFLFTTRDNIELFFALKPDHDPKRMGATTYVRVSDADAFHRLWASVPGLGELCDQPYKMRDFPLTDPDGNQIFFGSSSAPAQPNA